MRVGGGRDPPLAAAVVQMYQNYTPQQLLPTPSAPYGVTVFPRVTTAHIHPTDTRKFLSPQTLADTLLHSTAGGEPYRVPELVVQELRVHTISDLAGGHYDLSRLNPLTTATAAVSAEHESLGSEKKSMVFSSGTVSELTPLYLEEADDEVVMEHGVWVGTGNALRPTTATETPCAILRLRPPSPPSSSSPAIYLWSVRGIEVAWTPNGALAATLATTTMQQRICVVRIFGWDPVRDELVGLAAAALFSDNTLQTLAPPATALVSASSHGVLFAPRATSATANAGGLLDEAFLQTLVYPHTTTTYAENASGSGGGERIVRGAFTSIPPSIVESEPTAQEMAARNAVVHGPPIQDETLSVASEAILTHLSVVPLRPDSADDLATARAAPFALCVHVSADPQLFAASTTNAAGHACSIAIGLDAGARILE